MLFFSFVYTNDLFCWYSRPVLLVVHAFLVNHVCMYVCMYVCNVCL